MYTYTHVHIYIYTIYPYFQTEPGGPQTEPGGPHAPIFQRVLQNVAIFELQLTQVDLGSEG